MTPSESWKEEAFRMVAGISGVSPRVLDVMRSVPRHLFVPAKFRSMAYEDEPVPLPYGDATISAPHMVALQLEEADLRAGGRVLEIGSGSGYWAALAAELMGPEGRVFGLDIEPGLVREATRCLEAQGYGGRIELRAADGNAGWPSKAPFDRIIVSCATPEIFAVWKDQLASDGIVVAPVGDSWEQRLVKYRAGAPGGPSARGPRCRFVPLRQLLPSDI